MAGVSLGASSGRFRGSHEGCGLSHQSLSMGRGRRETRSGPRGGAWTEGRGPGGRATGGNMAELAGLQEKLPEAHARWSPCRPLRSHVPSFLSSIPSGHRYARLLYDLVLLTCLFWEPFPTFSLGPETQPLYLQCQAAWDVSVLD